MSYSQATLVNRVRFYLGDMPFETTGSANNATSVVSVADGDEWARGNYGEFVTDGDAFMVSEVNGFDLTAVRSYYGSTGAAHAAASRIVKEPKYKYNEITNAAATVIKTFLPWPYVYKVSDPVSITPTPTTATWYDLASDAMALVSVIQLGDNAPIQRERYGRFHKFDRVIFERNLPTTLVSTGVGIKFKDGFFDNNNTVFVKYAGRFTATVSAGSYTDFTDENAVTEAIILGTVSLLEGTLEGRKPRKSQMEHDNLRPAGYFNRLFHSALAQAQKEIHQKAPLMHVPRDV